MSKKLQEYLPTQQDRITRKLQERLTFLAIESIENCSVKNLTLEQFQAHMSNSFVGIATIPEFKFSDLTVYFLQEIGTEKLYEIYKDENVLPQNTGSISALKAIRATPDTLEIKSKQEFLIQQESDLILGILRNLEDGYISNNSFWKVVNRMTLENKDLRSKISEAIKSKMTDSEQKLFGFLNSKTENAAIENQLFTKNKTELLTNTECEIFTFELMDWLESNFDQICKVQYSDLKKAIQQYTVDQSSIFLIIDKLTPFQSVIKSKYNLFYEIPLVLRLLTYVFANKLHIDNEGYVSFNYANNNLVNFNFNKVLGVVTKAKIGKVKVSGGKLKELVLKNKPIDVYEREKLLILKIRSVKGFLNPKV
jgi:hypothetical protein